MDIPNDTQRPGRARHAARAAAMLALAAAAGPAWPARASTGYLPDAFARHEIELLADQAGLAVTTQQWPLPRAAVRDALDALPADLPPDLARARDALRADLDRDSAGDLQAVARTRTEMLAGYGETAGAASHLRLRGAEHDVGPVAGRLGAAVATAVPGADNGRLSLDGTEVAAAGFGVQVQAWQRAHWWGGGWDSALPLGTNAPALTGIGLQRAEAGPSASPLAAWMGPWSWESFFAQTQGETEPDHPFIVGNRLTMRPFPALEIGLTEMMQWGGRGRPESLGSLLKSLVGYHVNKGAGTATSDPDAANLLAGYDLRLRCPAGWPCALYAQMIGEDEHHRAPSRFLTLYGTEWTLRGGRDRVFLEYLDSSMRRRVLGAGNPAQPGAYYNGSYPQGYANGGRWLGAGAGSDARLSTLGWIDDEDGWVVKARWGHIGTRMGQFQPMDALSDTEGDVAMASVARRWRWRGCSLTPQLDWQRLDTSVRTHDDWRAGVTLDMPLDGTSCAPAWPAPPSGRLGAAVVGAGLLAAAFPLDGPVDRYASTHGHNTSARALHGAGAILPYAAYGLAGLDAVLERDSPRGAVAWQAIEASTLAAVTAETIKFAVDRPRPSGGPSHGTGRLESSFPSGHAAVAWGLATPFAQAYDAPWLYGVAAAVDASRVIGRDHWLSDVVASSVIGYLWGDWAHARGDSLRVALGPRTVMVSRTF